MAIYKSKYTGEELEKALDNAQVQQDIIFAGVINAEGWPDFTCNAPYEEARAKVEQGCTARVVLCDYSNTYPVFTHFPCVEVRLSSWKVTFEFMDLGRGDSMYLAYDENGNIGNGEE